MLMKIAAVILLLAVQLASVKALATTRVAPLSAGPCPTVGPAPLSPLRALRGGGKPPPSQAAPAKASSGLAMLLRIASMLGMYGLVCAGEHVLSARLLAPYLPALVAPSRLLGGAVSASYGLVILVNVVASSFMMMYLSFIPGGARRKFMEAAKKKGDRDAEARFSLPKLYAEGFSQEAKEFNCHQRAHQQALETYTNFVVCSIIGGVRQPLLTTAAGILYIIARVKWAKGYCTGDPDNRYKASGGWGKHIWYPLLLCAVVCLSASLLLYHENTPPQNAHERCTLTERKGAYLPLSPPLFSPPSLLSSSLPPSLSPSLSRALSL